MKNYLKITPGLEEMGLALNPLIESEPDGYNGDVSAISLKSSDPDAAENHNLGVPNVCVIINHGYNYYFNGVTKPNQHYPSVYISGYSGTPIPVVEPISGELVAVLTNYKSWNANKPGARVNILNDTSSVGISTADPRYDITLGGFFVQNIGLNYGSDTLVEIVDRDTGSYNGEVEPIIVDGRMVGIEVLNSGTGFLRTPRIDITSSTGYNAKVYPIMNIIAKTTSDPRVKKYAKAVQMVYCPSVSRKG